MRGEGFLPWRAARVRMPRRQLSRPKRARSPPRRRTEDDEERAGEDTATDEDVLLERRTKLRHDPHAAIPRFRDRAAARTPPNHHRRVVAAHSGSEEQPASPRREDDDLHLDDRYASQPFLGRLMHHSGRRDKRGGCWS